MKEIKAMLKYLILQDMIEESSKQLLKGGYLLRTLFGNERVGAKRLYDGLMEHHKKLCDASPGEEIEKILFGEKK